MLAINYSTGDHLCQVSILHFSTLQRSYKHTLWGFSACQISLVVFSARWTIRLSLTDPFARFLIEHSFARLWRSPWDEFGVAPEKVTVWVAGGAR
jgi:hypothetical protein